MCEVIIVMKAYVPCFQCMARPTEHNEIRGGPPLLRDEVCIFPNL